MKNVRYKGKIYGYDEAKNTLTELDASGNPTANAITDFAAADLEAVVGGDPGEVALNAMRAKLAGAEGELAKLRKSLGGLKPDEISSLVTELQERRANEEKLKQDELKKQGKFQELLDQKEKAIGELNAKYQTELSDWQGKFRSERINNTLLSLASRPEVVNPGQIVALVRSRVSLDENGNVVVLDETGKSPAVNDKMQPLAPKDFMDGFLKENPHFLRGHPGGAGSGGGAGGGTGAGTVRAKKDLKNDDERAAFIKEHGRDKYLSLPNG
jgi:hypothetical protein